MSRKSLPALHEVRVIIYHPLALSVFPPRCVCSLQVVGSLVDFALETALDFVLLVRAPEASHAPQRDAIGRSTRSLSARRTGARWRESIRPATALADARPAPRRTRLQS